jgi:ABC-type transport system substrate-binding protein
MCGEMQCSKAPLWGLVVFAVLAGACAPEPGVAPSGGAASVTTLPGDPELPVAAGDPGTVVVGIGTAGPPRTLNPLLDGPDTGVLDVISPALHAVGYRIDGATMDPVPVVLDEIPSTDNGLVLRRPDGALDVTVRVAEWAMWSDGAPITAEDLAFTYRLAVDPSLPIRSDVRERYERILPGSMVADGRELRFRMETSMDVELLFDVIVPKHQVEGTDFTTAWNDTTWVGGGPFVFASYQPGQYLELTRNEQWPQSPGSGGGREVERVVFRFYRGDLGVDPRVLRAFETRVLDVVLIPDAQHEAATYQALEREGARVETASGRSWLLFNFQFGPANRNEESLNEHFEFRKAVAHALDREALADARDTVPLWSALAMYRPGLSSGPWADYTFDIERTKGALFDLGEELGVDLFAGDGPRLVVTTASEAPESAATAGDVAVLLDQAGIGAELQLEGSELLFGRTLDNGTWDTAVWRFTAAPGRASAIGFVTMFDPDGLPFAGYNFFRWGTVDSLVRNDDTERYAQIIDELERTVDRAEIDRLLVEAETLLAENLVIVPLIVHELTGAAWWSGEVTGVALDPYGGVTGTIGEWRVPDV